MSRVERIIMTDKKAQLEHMQLVSADMIYALLFQLHEAAPKVYSEGHVNSTKLQAVLGEHIEAGMTQ